MIQLALTKHVFLLAENTIVKELRLSVGQNMTDIAARIMLIVRLILAVIMLPVAGLEEIVHQKPPTDGSLFFVIAMSIVKFHIAYRKLSKRYLSLKQQTNIKIKHDENGYAMIDPFNQS